MIEPFKFIAPGRLPDPRDFTEPVTDGDTLWLQLDRHDRSKQGVHAPDKADGPTRDLAREFVQGWVVTHGGATKWPFLVQTVRIRDESHEIMTLGRYVARVWCRECGSVLNVEAEAWYRSQGWPLGN
jgi:hypothetical protein